MSLFQEDLRLLSSLKNLSTVRVDVGRSISLSDLKSPNVQVRSSGLSSHDQQRLDVLLEVLKQNKSKEKKRICLHRYEYVPSTDDLGSGTRSKRKRRETDIIEVE